MRSVMMNLTDSPMDSSDMGLKPANPLPKLCETCEFRDLDHLPEFYQLVRSRTRIPKEAHPAAVGNLLVRERVESILKLATPGACCFLPTVYKGTSEATPWRLAVPLRQYAIATVKPTVKRCVICGEPLSAHPGSQWEMLPEYPDCHFSVGVYHDFQEDIVKSSTWGTTGYAKTRNYLRCTFVSIRLFTLLERLKVKGIEQTVTGPLWKPILANSEELTWVDEKLALLAASGICIQTDDKPAASSQAWLNRYIKKHAQQEPINWNQQAVESLIGVGLPKSYIDFVSKLGLMSFDECDDLDGDSVRFLPPEQVHFQDHHEQEDDESRSLKALCFATTLSGDTFCFDVQPGKEDFAVLHFNHEAFMFEPFAASFADAVRRFTGS